MPSRLLLDTNVLVALSEPRDELNRRASTDLARFRRAEMFTTGAALMESCLVLRESFQRVRLHKVLARSEIRSYPGLESEELWSEVLDWMDSYAEHQPDWTDALYAVLSGRDKSLQIWTYDSEFTTIWRRPDGSTIALAVEPW